MVVRVSDHVLCRPCVLPTQIQFLFFLHAFVFLSCRILLVKTATQTQHAHVIPYFFRLSRAVPCANPRVIFNWAHNILWAKPNSCKAAYQFGRRTPWSCKFCTDSSWLNWREKEKRRVNPTQAATLDTAATRSQKVVEREEKNERCRGLEGFYNPEIHFKNLGFSLLLEPI